MSAVLGQASNIAFRTSVNAKWAIGLTDSHYVTRCNPMPVSSSPSDYTQMGRFKTKRSSAINRAVPWRSFSAHPIPVNGLSPRPHYAEAVSLVAGPPTAPILSGISFCLVRRDDGT
jgi:hypothetical protein